MSSATHSPSSMVTPPLFPQPEPCRQPRSPLTLAHRLATKRSAPDDDISHVATYSPQPRAPGGRESVGVAAASPWSPVAKRFKPATSKTPELSSSPTNTAFSPPSGQLSPWTPTQSSFSQTGRKRALDADLVTTEQAIPGPATATKRPRVALKCPHGRGVSFGASSNGEVADAAFNRIPGALTVDRQLKDGRKQESATLPPASLPFTTYCPWSSSTMDPRSLTIPPEPNLETGKVIDVDTGEVLDAAPLSTAATRPPPAALEAGSSLSARWVTTCRPNNPHLALTGTGKDRATLDANGSDSSDRFELLVDWPTTNNCPDDHGYWSLQHPGAASPTPTGSSWQFQQPTVSLPLASTSNHQALVLYRPDHNQPSTGAFSSSGQTPPSTHHHSSSLSAIPTPFPASLAPLQPATESDGSPSSPEATAMDLD
ncbi:hypothetical protein H4R34_004361 [Dimargaris verticillata]|uniref:Uncharacterized protein n=1 Tax=Dimargaris verticillata TaxID=2761393 RepID=A0A9W8B2R7_9FUNG|nr:hypothetical protein H4R34_004361 [Dimargaris verticillata]